MPIMTPDELHRFLEERFPQAAHIDLKIEHLDDNSIRVRLPTDDSHLRPGGTLSGPTLVWLADLAFYLLLIGRLGDGAAQAVTTNLTINFMRKPEPADLLGEGRLMKLGRTLAVGDFTIWSRGVKDAVAHATLTYAIPARYHNTTSSSH